MQIKWPATIILAYIHTYVCANLLSVEVIKFECHMYNWTSLSLSCTQHSTVLILSLSIKLDTFAQFYSYKNDEQEGKLHFK